MPGRITNLFLKVEHGEPMRAVRSVRAVAGQGLAEDRAFGAAKRQVLLIERETLLRFGLAPGDARENITLEGLSMGSLPQSARLRAGEAVLEVVGDCAPCSMLDDLRPGLQEAIRGQRGVLARVIEGGQVKVGDGIAILEDGLAPGQSRRPAEQGDFS